MKGLIRLAMKLSLLAFIIALTGCVSTSASYLVYNHENDGGEVPLFMTPDIETAGPSKCVDSKTKCALIEVKPEKGVHKIGLGKVDYDIIGGKHKAEEMLYVKCSYVREKLTKYKVGVIAGRRGGYNDPQVSLDGQELDSVTPSHGYSDEFRNPANGRLYGSNDGGHTLTEI